MSEPLKILYRNHRGKVAVRTIMPMFTYFTSTQWHPEPQWVLQARDAEKNAVRDFALGDILAIGEEAIAAYQEMRRQVQLAREEGARDD